MNELQPKFDYAKVGSDVAEELRKHEVAIRVIQAKAIYEMGTELHAAHETLAKRGYGNFYGWCQTCFGMSSSTVDNYVHAYKLIAQNLGKREMLEELPKSLLYAASTESAPPELTQKVLDGEITTHKQWQEEKKALQDRAEQAEARAEQAEQSNQALTEQFNEQSKELQELKDNPTVVEVVPDDYNNLQSKCRRLQSANESYAKANEELRHKLAKKEASESGMSLQELAEEDEAFAQYLKSKHQEAKDAKIFYEAIRNLSRLPNELPEVKELCRCYIAHEATDANRAFTMKSMAQEIRLNIRKLEAALEVFEQRKLGVVK